MCVGVWALPQPAVPRVEVENLYTDLLIHIHKDLHIYTHNLDCLALGLQLAVKSNHLERTLEGLSRGTEMERQKGHKVRGKKRT